MQESRTILLADMESFYASVEIAADPSLQGKPVAVCGDPRLRHGIVLAASREAKNFGIKTGMPAWECRRYCPRIIFVRPHMSRYLETSLRLTLLFEEFTDRVFPYSIDEQFLDITGCQRIFGSAAQVSSKIIDRVQEEINIRCQIGIGENPLQAKMACSQFAKKNKEGIFELNHQNYARHIWPLPVKDLFGVGYRMERNLNRMGLRTIGHLAQLPKEILIRRWGINGEVLWLNAHGLDQSPVSFASGGELKGVGQSMTLPRDYWKIKEIGVVLLELTEEVCRRARALGKMGRVISVYGRGADFDQPTGFSRQSKLLRPTALTLEVYPQVKELFLTHWDRRPLRAVGVRLTGLVSDCAVQLSWFGNRERADALTRAMDDVRKRFGPTSLFRASSLSAGAQLFNRAKMIGGHEA